MELMGWIGSAVIGMAVFNGASGGLQSCVQAISEEGGSTVKSFEAKTSEDWSLPRNGAGGLRITIPSGAIRVTPSEGDQLQVHLLKQSQAPSETAAQAFLPEMKIERRRDGDRWVIEASWPEPQVRHVQSPSVTLDLRVPRAMRLEAESQGGPIEATGVGEAHLHTDGGEIRAQELTGNLEARTAGPINVSGCAGSVQADTTGGNIVVRQVRGAVKVSTGGGDIRVEECSGPVEARNRAGGIKMWRTRSPVTASTGAGNIEVEVAHENNVTMDLETGAGDIDLRLPENVALNLKAEANNGRFEVTLPPGSSFKRGSTHLEAVVGGGQGLVRLHVSNGVIRVRPTGPS